MDSTFEELGRRFVDEVTALSPVSATMLGDHRYDDRVDEVSDAARQRRAEFCREYLAQLDKVPADRLSRANQIDAAVLEHNLRGTLWHLEELQEWAWNPTSYTGLAGGAVYGLMARDFAPLAERLKNLAARLEQFPRLMEQIRSTLVPSRVPKVHAETAVKQNRGVLSILDEMVAPHLDVLDGDDRGRLVAAMETARAAVEDHQQWLENDLLPKAAGEFRLGAETYDRKLAFTLHSPMTRQQIREVAESELRRVRREMYDLAAEIYRKEFPCTKFPAEPSEQYKQAIVRAGLEMAYAETLEPEKLVATATESLAMLTAFVKDKDLVTVPPDPVDVIVMPEFRRGHAFAYCDSPGPLDVGQKSFYALAPPPADWSDRQLRSYLREYNTRSLHNLSVHEAMPGHFLQLTHSNRYPSTLRAMLSSGVFIEGWAVYTEHMMVEQGLLDGDPLMRLVVLKWLLRGIVNAIIDQAIHAEDMGESEAMELMIEGAFQEEREAAGKWVRAQLSSTQLSTYFVGYLEHVSLRREIAQARGDGFDLKAYHDTLLSFGSPPTQYVRAMMLDVPIG